MIEKDRLPKHWEMSRLGDICSSPQYGYTTSGSKTGDLQLLRTTDITSGTIDWSTVPFCTVNPKDVEKYLLKDGDIVISRAGSVGVSYLLRNPERSVFASYLIRFKPLENVTSLKFFSFFLKSPFYWDEITEKSLGIALLNVNATKLKEIRIPLPPLQEQERIVAKIEELFSELDAGVESLKKAKAQLRTYRQAVLKSAYDGHLTNKNVPAGELPEGWTWARSGDLFEFVTSGARGWAKYYSDAGAIFLRITNLDFDSLLLDLAPDKIQRVNAPDTLEARRIKVRTGDFLISITGYLGMFAIVPDMEEAYINQHISLCRPKTGFIPKYVGYWIISSSGGIHHLNHMRKGAVKAGLGLDDIKSFPVPLCGMGEQHQIVEEIESRISVCDKLEETIAASLKQSEVLRQTILQQAFEGRLVAQNKNDEPASILLERIRTERQTVEERQQRDKTRPRKVGAIKRMTEKLKTILELLEENRGPMPTRNVWQASIHRDNIDAFYSELKKLSDQEKIKETEREGRESFLTLVGTK